MLTMIRRLFPMLRRAKPADRFSATGVEDSVSYFRKLMDRERYRADRTGIPVSLVLCHPVIDEQSRDGRQTLEFRKKQLEEFLHNRLRCTDSVGTLSTGDLCVLLPDTGMHGARCVAREIARFYYGQHQLPLRCEIYIYPAPGPASELEPGIDQEEEGDISERKHEAGWSDARRADPRTQNARSRNARDEHEDDDDPPDGDIMQQPVRTMDELFRHDLPGWKRALDIIISLATLVTLSPFLMGAAFAVRISSRGPVFFRQQRAGLGGKPFTILKFRTMYEDAEQRKQALLEQSEQDGPAFKMKNDPRITPVGRILRRSSIDELPQLWNVLRGDMTIVGPRPLPCNESDACDGWRRRRLDITPGLTCIWQLDGGSKVTFDEWMRMDIRYLTSYAPWTDLYLIVRTAIKVITHRAST